MAAVVSESERELYTMSTKRYGKVKGGILLLLFGIAMTVYAALNLSKGGSASNWPTTEGKILESKMEKGTSGTGSNRTIQWYPTVKYRYEVDASTYEGDRIIFGSSAELPSATLDRYPVGATVKVFYNPDNPETAVLQTGSTSSMYLYVILGPILAIIGTILLVLSARGYSFFNR